MASSTSRPIRFAAPLLAVAALGLAACSANDTPSDVPGTTPPVFTGAPNPSAPNGATGQSISGEFEGVDGKSMGTVTFTDEGDHVEITVAAEGLTPGFHAFHIHQNPVCDANSVAPSGGAPGAFLSAGGHLQVGGRTEHPASGDLTSLQARQDGHADLMTTSDAFTLNDLRKGVSVIVHSGPDNFANIPTRYTLPDGAPVPDETTLMTGDAGSRVACAIVG